MRWRWPGESDCAVLADLGVVALRQAQDQVVDVRALRGAHHLGRVGRRPGARCSPRRCRRKARRPAADSRGAARAARAARPPRRRRRGARLPAAGFQTPTMRRASVDLPDALGPMMPSDSPAVRRNETPRRIGRSAFGSRKTHAARRSSSPVGAGSSVRASPCGLAPSSSAAGARRRAPRPGCASPRPASRPAPARGRAGSWPRSSCPAVACCATTRYAPVASIASWMSWRANLVQPEKRGADARSRASARASAASFSAGPAPASPPAACRARSPPRRCARRRR